MKPCRNNNDILANGNHIFFRRGLHVHFYGNIGQGFATSAGVAAFVNILVKNYDSVCVKVNLKSVFPIAE